MSSRKTKLDFTPTTTAMFVTDFLWSLLDWMYSFGALYFGGGGAERLKPEPVIHGF